MTPIGFCRKCLNPIFIGCVALSLTAAGCGGDDEKGSATSGTTSTAQQPSDTATATTETETEGTTETETTGTATEPTDTSPEDEPGGAGDEVPAYTQALFTGRDGQITPRVIRVPAFISIRVELRSLDGREYGLRFDGKTIKLSGELSSVSTTLDGLRSGGKVVGTPIGATGEVRIEATAEPGP